MRPTTRNFMGTMPPPISSVSSPPHQSRGDPHVPPERCCSSSPPRGSRFQLAWSSSNPTHSVGRPRCCQVGCSNRQVPAFGADHGPRLRDLRRRDRDSSRRPAARPCCARTATSGSTTGSGSATVTTRRSASTWRPRTRNRGDGAHRTAPAAAVRGDQEPRPGDRRQRAGPQGTVRVLRPHHRGTAVRHPVPAPGGDPGLPDPFAAAGTPRVRRCSSTRTSSPPVATTSPSEGSR